MDEIERRAREEHLRRSAPMTLYGLPIINGETGEPLTIADLDLPDEPDGRPEHN